MANMPKLRPVMLSLIVFSFFALAVPPLHTQAQTFTVLYNFGAHNGDPVNPQWSGIIAQGRDGTLYTTVTQGGGGYGSVISITPSGTFNIVHNFNGHDEGLSPTGGLSLGLDGNFYGTTCGCGFGLGTIFKVTPGGSLSTMYTFANGLDGSNPLAPPIQGLDGNFYGTASNGNQGQGFFGSVYKITPSGTFTTLKSLDFTSGAFPQDPLVQGTNGYFYGTTENGTPSNNGNTFRISSTGKFTSLFSFDGTHGHNPFAPLIQATDGNFYGTVKLGGTSNLGTTLRMSAAGKITVLYNFAGTGDGTEPVGGLVQASDGNLYGTTSMADGSAGCGTIFRMTTKGVFSTVFTFPSDASKGCNPLVTLTQHTNGILYGDTFGGGTGNNNHGVFFSFDAGLKSFIKLMTTTGKVGDTIEILGQGFTGASNVSIGGTSASFQVVSDTYLTAIVPAGAKTGLVTVTTPGGKLSSLKKFLVIPQITSFNPTSGPVGTAVTITGVSLIQTTKVTFGGVAATFTANSDTQVTATVPTAAKTGKIGITTPGGKTTSSGTFTVTP